MGFTPVYAGCEVELVGQDGNAFNVMGLCRQAFRAYCRNNTDVNFGVEWKKIQAEMMSGDYDHLLQTAMKFFDVT
jgi:hypothetical protein